MTSELDAVAFAEKVLSLLDQGRFVATYKYAVLLGLIDLCLENVSSNGLQQREERSSRGGRARGSMGGADARTCG
jgi:hypothetical protein